MTYSSMRVHRFPIAFDYTFWRVHGWLQLLTMIYCYVPNRLISHLGISFSSGPGSFLVLSAAGNAGDHVYTTSQARAPAEVREARSGPSKPRTQANIQGETLRLHTS